jgi:hypothetical protein
MADLVPSGTSVAHLGMRRGPLLRLRQDRFMVLRSYGKGAARVAAPGAYAVASSRLIAGLISSASIGRPRLCPSGLACGWITGESARRAWKKGTASRHGCHLPVSGLGTPKVPGITLWPRQKVAPDSQGTAPVPGCGAVRPSDGVHRGPSPSLPPPFGSSGSDGASRRVGQVTPAHGKGCPLPVPLPAGLRCQPAA